MTRNKWLTMMPALILAIILPSACVSSDTNNELPPVNDMTSNDEVPPDDEPSLTENHSTIVLPEPIYESDTSVEEALSRRRSVREYSDKPLTQQEVSQLLWAAQGITDASGKRTAPSAGALYPLEVYVAIGNVESISPGVYKYQPLQHELEQLKDDDRREALAMAALNQLFIAEGAIVIVIAGVYDRTTIKYGDRGIRYVYMEAGHAAQNIYLQAVTLNLGTVTVGAFYDDRVKEILNMPDEEAPLYIMPVGKPVND